MASDWIWHTSLPPIAYTTLLVAAITLPGSAEGSLFAIAAASILLLFIGLHNAWDTVTYVVVQETPGPKVKSRSS